MSSSDFRQITQSGALPKPDKLFRAAVSAFCSLTRPARRDVAQLEDLTLPLFDSVSTDTRRYVAAALSECPAAPESLVKRLVDESIDIAAPLLIKSNAVADVDLIALIGRHGLPHARAIARRPDLNTTIAELVSALEAAAPKPPRSRASDQAPGSAAEETRRRLRGMMAENADGPIADETHTLICPSPVPAYGKLRQTALSGNRAFFQTALADALQIDFAVAGRILTGASYASLSAALKALELTEEQAFVVTAALYPALFAHAESVRLFLSRYAVLHRDVAREKARAWKAESLVASIARNAPAQPVRAARNDALPRPRLDLRVRSA